MGCDTMQRMSTDILVTTIQKALQDSAPRFGIMLAVLFGSRATGRVHAQSDYDIAVYAEHPLSPAEIAACAYELSVSLKQKDIEVVDIRAASPSLLHAISRDGVVLLEQDAHAFAQFQMYAYKRFVEAKPLREMRLASLQTFAAPLSV